MKNSTAGANLLEKRKEKICLNALKNHVKNDERELGSFFFYFLAFRRNSPCIHMYSDRRGNFCKMEYLFSISYL